jgi:hypothetical protein
MNHLMIDLETMGNKPTAPIVSIGAVFFDPQSGKFGEEFYTAVQLESAMAQGAQPDGDTIIWWMKQSTEARAAICADDAMSISVALLDLTQNAICHLTAICITRWPMLNIRLNMCLLSGRS